jgi:hypothetical protein
MTRDEAQAWFVQLLMDNVRRDPYPSATQMTLIEQSLPREMVPEYLGILMDKVAKDNVPSLMMLRRIQNVAATLPQYERQS